MALIMGTSGNDTLTGGLGNDTFVGGAGADRFVFDFGMRTVAGGSSDFGGWLAANGLQPIRDGVTTQSEFVHAYGDWLHWLVRTFSIGGDLNADGEVSVGLQQNDPTGVPEIEGLSSAQVGALFNASHAVDVVTGNHTTQRFYADSFTIGDRPVFSGLGADTIADFSRAEGDKIAVSGITIDNVSNFRVHVADVDGDGRLDTVFSLVSDPTWSLTLSGYTGFGAQDLMLVAPAGGMIVNGTAGNDILMGGAGNDTLTGFKGNDVLTGGAGADRFVLAFGNSTGVFSGPGSDIITDFHRAEGDKLVLSGLTVQDALNFRVATLDLNGDGTLDTRITLVSDPGWSLELLGVSDLNAALDVEVI